MAPQTRLGNNRDDPARLSVSAGLSYWNINASGTEKVRKIWMAIFNVDGVLTGGSLHFAFSGEEIKTFDSHDDHDMGMLKASGVELAIITSMESRCVDSLAQQVAYLK